MAVTASADHKVVDRRRIELIEPGWNVHFYDAGDVEAQAVSRLAERADEILLGPRATIGPPWAKDHRTTLAATIVAGEDGIGR